MYLKQIICHLMYWIMNKLKVKVLQKKCLWPTFFHFISLVKLFFCNHKVSDSNETPEHVDMSFIDEKKVCGVLWSEIFELFCILLLLRNIEWNLINIWANMTHVKNFNVIVDDTFTYLKLYLSKIFKTMV